MGDVLGQTVVGERNAVQVRLEPWQAEGLRREGLVVEQDAVARTGGRAVG